MHRVYDHAVVVASLLFMLSVTPGWGGGLPSGNCSAPPLSEYSYPVNLTYKKS